MHSKQRWLYKTCGFSLALMGSLITFSSQGFARVLVQPQEVERPVQVSRLQTLRQNPDRLALFFNSNSRQLGSLPAVLTNSVVRDAQARLRAGGKQRPNRVETDLRVESIQRITWNACNGGTGPTPPWRGTCPNISVAGWQMVILGQLQQTPFRFVYYIPATASRQSFVPVPDGMQSLPNAVKTRILEAAVRDTGLPVNELHFHWIDARWFDASLNTASEQMSHRNTNHPGWEIEILGSRSLPGRSWATPLWKYHANLTGTEARLIYQGHWVPPPSAPLPR